MSLSDNLKKLRNNLKLTQNQVSKDLKMNRATYAHYETGRREPDIETLKLLAQYFNVTIDELLSDNIISHNINPNLGTKIKNLRKEKKLTQEDVAKYLRISDRSIEYYENGQRIPPLDILKKIANFFNVSLDYLLGQTDIKRSIKEIIKEVEKNKNSTNDSLPEELQNLSPESQEEIKKLIELYKIKDMQNRNTEISDEISKPE